MRSFRETWILLALVLSLALFACGGRNPFEIDLMPAPDVYEEGELDPFDSATPIDELPYRGILYATDRMPAGEGDKERYYSSERGGSLRLGRADVELVNAEISWEEAREISLLKNRSAKYPIAVSGVEEYGPLDRSAVPFMAPGDIGSDPSRPADTFAAAINQKLSVSNRKDVYVYVHGYRVVFENPVLVATELWHFTGYDGVFIAYAWPATPSRWAYLKDTETAAGLARNLRILIEFLAEETDAEEIHVLGYSAGTRLVAHAFEQLALIHTESTPDEIRRELRVGNLILIGSDLDRRVFGSYLADGLLEIPRRLTIYTSAKDKALGMSEMLTRRERLGQLWLDHPEELEDYLNEQEGEFDFIDVTAAEGGTSGNGHAYFRKSPWASSDVLMTMLHDLGPEQRGLVRRADAPLLWTFPPDYIERLRVSLSALGLRDAPSRE